MKEETEAELLKEILASPHDDALRLVYADLLLLSDDEQKRSRGELIQQQIAKGGIVSGSYAQRSAVAPGGAWMAPLVDLLEEWDFARGFVRFAAVAPHAVGRMSELYDSEPVVEVWLRSGRGQRLELEHLERFLETPLPWRLRRLRIGPMGLGAEGARLLATSPHLAPVERLSLLRCEIEDNALRALANSIYLDRLSHLNIQENFNITDRGLHALLDSNHLPQLTSVGVSRGLISAADREGCSRRFTVVE